MAKVNRYSQIIETIFLKYFVPGNTEVAFRRSDIEEAAGILGITLPKNLGDVIYSFKYRSPLPESVTEHAPKGKSWVIVGKGRSKYAFQLKVVSKIQPNTMLPVTKVPDATPAIVARYALNDEQALLARLRYNRLIDIFTGITCYSIQNHLRTTVSGIGQVETDEIYVGLDRRGAHFVLPIQAKGRTDEIGIVQIEQDMALCREKFPDLEVRSIAAQFLNDEVIVLFEFGQESDLGIVSLAERHYQLVAPQELSAEELAIYRNRPQDWR